MLTSVFFFFFNDTATTEIYTLSLHDALPISLTLACRGPSPRGTRGTRLAHLNHDAACTAARRARDPSHARSEEHTSELQSRSDLVCRLLLEKKKQTYTPSWNQPRHSTELPED